MKQCSFIRVSSYNGSPSSTESSKYQESGIITSLLPHDTSPVSFINQPQSAVSTIRPTTYVSTPFIDHIFRFLSIFINILLTF